MSSDRGLRPTTGRVGAHAHRGLALRRGAALVALLALLGAGIASAAPHRASATAVVMHERVAKPGRYRIRLAIWSSSPAREIVTLRIGRRTRRVTIDRGHRRVRLTIRVKLAHRRFAIHLSGTRLRPVLHVRVRGIAAIAATGAPSGHHPTPSGPTGSTGTTGKTGASSPTGASGATGTTGTAGSTAATGPTAPSGTETPSGAAIPIGDLPGWHQTLAEDFSGTTLASGWGAYTGQPGGDPGGWFDASHVTVFNGELQIASYRDAAHCPSACTAIQDLVSGGVQLYGHAQTYGKYEVRMRADNARGMGLTVLLWPVAPVWPPEIDIVADGGQTPRIGTATGTVHYAPGDTEIGVKNTTADLSQWHTWGAEWSPGKVVYTLDGAVWATTANANVSSIPMNLAIQIQGYSCGIGGTVCPDATTPAMSNFDVDWVVQYAPA